jgi:elongation factor G
VKSYPTDRVRNILIVGHGGAGKTSLVEAVCHATGATNRLGRVEDGTTVTDFEPEETRKHISVSLAVAPVEHDGFKINLLDAPGYADFIGDVRSALPAADAVLFVVSAVEGVETQTEVVWTMAEELGLPRAFFINKLDRDRASFSRSLDGIQAAFGKSCPPLYLPIGEEQDFRGLVGLLSGRAYTGEGGKRTEGEVPA